MPTSARGWSSTFSHGDSRTELMTRSHQRNQFSIAQSFYTLQPSANNQPHTPPKATTFRSSTDLGVKIPRTRRRRHKNQSQRRRKKIAVPRLNVTGGCNQLDHEPAERNDSSATPRKITARFNTHCNNRKILGLYGGPAPSIAFFLALCSTQALA